MQVAVFHAVIPFISCLLASPLLIHESYTHGSHIDRSSCFLSFSTAPIEILEGVVGLNCLIAAHPPPKTDPKVALSINIYIYI